MIDDPSKSAKAQAAGVRPDAVDDRSVLDTRVEQAGLEELRRAYRLLLGSEGAYWERNLRTGQVWFSDKFLSLLGLQPGVDRHTVNSFLHPDDRAEFDRRYRAAIAAVGQLDVDVRYRCRDGDYRWVRIQGRIWAGSDGQPECVIGMAIDVDAEKQAQLGMQRLTDQFSRAMEASVEAHFERSNSDQTFFISPQIVSLLGLPAGTTPPTRDEFLALVHADDLPRLQAILSEKEANPGPWSCDYRVRQADGVYRWVRARGRTERRADGELLTNGLIGDIHEQRLAQDELIEHRERLQQMVDERTASLEAALNEAQRQRKEAERANEAKSTFLAHMSHEVRTPLNGLLGLNELALREATSEQQRRYLKLALQSGAGLLDMLNGVLDFSRVTAGAAPSRGESFDLAEVLATCMRRSMPQARAKGLGMMYDYVGPVTLVVGDTQRLQQVVVNLLNNAVKYTDSGHVALRAEVAADGPQSCLARIEVRDTGPGMSQQVAARIFEPFVQGDESLARKYGGSGLGLSIALGLARAMKGNLSVETAPGEGATFQLTLPLQLQAGKQPMEHLPDPGLAWLVYNRRVPAEWLAMRLHRLGWESEIFELSDLLEQTTSPEIGHAPDLLVLAEAVLDSADSLQRIRALLPQSPAVLLVRPDWNQPEIEAAARANDMPLVFMPLTPGALLELTIMHGRKTATADSGFTDLPGTSGASADILIAEDNPVNQLIVSEMISALGLRARLVEDGAGAIAACLTKAPDLVLMDLQMPMVDGIEATRQLIDLQKRTLLAPFPIVALTAHATPQDRQQCLDCGMQGYLTKPISLAQLRIELGRWLNL